jgi:predicted nucleic acid-binding protein
MLRVVLDPVVVLRGLLNPHSICSRLLSEYAYNFKVVVSEEIIRALILLCYHPTLIAKYRRLSKVEPTHAARLFLRAEKASLPADRDGNIFVATAIAAKVDYLVCEDQALLALRQKVKVPIIDTRAFIMLLETRSAP